jgi:site-specific DNA recombinase
MKVPVWEKTHMSMFKPSPRGPKNGHTPRVLIVCRISGCTKQKELSNDDQEDNAKEVAHEVFEGFRGNIYYKVIATKGKGERLDRPELVEIEKAYLSGEWDLVIFDDLSRLIRGGEAARLLGLGVDCDTRTICIQDGIDTADPNWEEDALNACSENVAHNERTSKRLKQKLMNRFKKFGGATSREIAGYTVPDDAKTFDDWSKTPGAEVWIVGGKKLLEASPNYEAAAEWLNDKSVPTGPYCKKDRWDGKMVKRFYHNTLLKGEARRGVTRTKKTHTTGRRDREPNPEGPTYYSVPHLAYFDTHEYDKFIADLKAAHAGKGRRKKKDEQKPRERFGVVCRRTRYPGNASRCWYCGSVNVWGGNGVSENLMCNGSRRKRCWNSFGFNGRLAAERILAVIASEFRQLHGFDDQYRALIAASSRDTSFELERARAELKREEAELAALNANIRAAIKAFGDRGPVGDLLRESQEKEQTLTVKRRTLERATPRDIQIPQSSDELRGLFDDASAQLSWESPEFGELITKLVPGFWVYLVRLCDGGHLLPRARLQIRLDGIVEDARHVAGLTEFLTRDVTIDLFDQAPQRERIRGEAVRLGGADPKPRQIVRQLSEKATETAVQNALKLQRRMNELSLTSPYLLIESPPDDYTKMRRHKHPKYRYEPLEGYVRPML